MRYKMIERKSDKIAYQKRLHSLIRDTWSHYERRVVTWRPDTLTMSIAHNREFWSASKPPRQNQKNPRFWNSFGRYQDRGNLSITVEINIAVETNGKSIAGFFARDTSSGEVYLMHDGRIGGGRKGVGRSSFLKSSGEKMIPVETSSGVRLGILVARLHKNEIGLGIARFVNAVDSFKQASAHGDPDAISSPEVDQSYHDYFDEFAGKKRRQLIDETEYLSRHGDIVSALKKWRKGLTTADERIVKNAYIDLGVHSRDVLTELYEVKTSCDRQILYGGIGQIIVHSSTAKNEAKKFLVLPEKGKIPLDVANAIAKEKITVLRFRLTDTSVIIHEAK